MKIIPASFEIMACPDGSEALRLIELAGRTCYKSEDRITPESAEAFAGRLLESHHESVIEHVSATVRFTVDRGVSHELVRHRLASFSQESTRYCNYSKGKFDGELTFILPPWIDCSSHEFEVWHSCLQLAEDSYKHLLARGWTPQQARSVLPNSLKTEVVVTTNLREWRHVLRLRTSIAAHPQMREVMCPLAEEFNRRIPVLFEEFKAW